MLRENLPELGSRAFNVAQGKDSVLVSATSALGKNTIITIIILLLLIIITIIIIIVIMMMIMIIM